MASMDFDASGEPQALEAALGLAVGTRYYVQNADTVASLRLRSAAVQPSRNARAHVLASGSALTVEPEAGESTWAWSDDGVCAVIVTEAPS